MKNSYWIILIFLGLLPCCTPVEEPIIETCEICDEYSGKYTTDVIYSEWDALYDDWGEFIAWELFEDLSSANEIEVILTDYDSKTFQLNDLKKSYLVDIPATFSEENQRLQFEHELMKDGNNWRILKGHATISGDSIFVESTLQEFGYYFPGTEIFESHISETGEKI